MSLFGLVGLALSKRRLLLWTASVCVAVTVVVVLVLPRQYSVAVILLPEANDTQSGVLSQLASNLGVVMGGGSGQTPEFYADLLKSRELTGAIVDSSMHWSGPPLETVLKKTRADSALRREETIDALTDRIGLKTDDVSGTVTFTVTVPDAAAAYLCSRTGVALVNKFDEARRRSRAAAERDFMRQRLDSAAATLRSAEDAASDFLTRNRELQSSPLLTLEYARLTRAVQLATTVYTGLAQMGDQAAIEAGRTTPSVTVVTHPSRPARPDKLHLGLKAVVAAVIGGWLGLLLAMVQVRAAGTDLGSPEFERRAVTEVATAADKLRRRWSRAAVRSNARHSPDGPANGEAPQ